LWPLKKEATKLDIIIRINTDAKVLMELQPLNIADLKELEKALPKLEIAMGKVPVANTKQLYIEYIKAAAPKVKNLSRLKLDTLRKLSEVFFERSIKSTTK